MDQALLQTFGASLERCTSKPGFLDMFYEVFLSSSPKVQEKFANTDFEKQKETLRASFALMLRAARQEGDGPPVWLDSLAHSHGGAHLAVGAELYDLWLDSLLVAVKVFDPEWSPEVTKAWEHGMGVGIRYLVSRYHKGKSL